MIRHICTLSSLQWLFKNAVIMHFMSISCFLCLVEDKWLILVGKHYMPLLSARARQVFENIGFYIPFKPLWKYLDVHGVCLSLLEWTIHVGRLGCEGTELKALNAMWGVGFTGTEEIWSHWVTLSENSPLGQSIPRRPGCSATAVLPFVWFKAYFGVSCSEHW